MANDMGEVGYVHQRTGTVVWVPSAHTVEVRRCDDTSCEHMHLFLMDQNGQPIAEAAVTEEFAQRLVSGARQA